VDEWLSRKCKCGDHSVEGHELIGLWGTMGTALDTPTEWIKSNGGSADGGVMAMIHLNEINQFRLSGAY